MYATSNNRISTGNADEGYGLKTARVLGRGELLVPVSMQYLNPDQEGRRSFLYRIWAFDPLLIDGPTSFEQCAGGFGMCHPFGWFSDFGDLWKLGRHDAPMLRARFDEALEDYKAMTLALVKAMDEAVSAGTQWTFAWSPCDLLWRATPVGTAPYAVTARGSKGSR